MRGTPSALIVACALPCALAAGCSSSVSLVALPPRPDPYGVFVVPPEERAQVRLPRVGALPARVLEQAVLRMVGGWSDADRSARLTPPPVPTQGEWIRLGNIADLGSLVVTEDGIVVEGPVDLVESTTRFVAAQAAAAARGLDVRLRFADLDPDDAPSVDVACPLATGEAVALISAGDAERALRSFEHDRIDLPVGGLAGELLLPGSFRFTNGRPVEDPPPAESLTWSRSPPDVHAWCDGCSAAVQVAPADEGRVLLLDLCLEQRGPLEEAIELEAEAVDGAGLPHHHPVTHGRVARLNLAVRAAVGADEALLVTQAGLTPGTVRVTIVTWAWRD